MAHALAHLPSTDPIDHNLTTNELAKMAAEKHTTYQEAMPDNNPTLPVRMTTFFKIFFTNAAGTMAP